ncbi:MAG: tyrosine-protein phosphatase [Eubacteriales bacterium]|nr:tyrosine-protein phosphatase [Eubacteriales bacterium]
MKMKKFFCFLLAVICVLSLAGCGSADSSEISAAVTRDTKYDAAVVSISAEEFEKAGFHLGDSCEIRFENGYSLSDVPYYNGYYVKNGAPVIVAYPGYTNISITLNKSGIWDAAKLSENDSVTIRLKEAGKYSATHEVLGQEYSFDYSDYNSSEEFCNFREMAGGELKKGFLFRGASPFDSSRGRAFYTDRLLRAAGISFVVDLADSEEDMAGYLSEETFDSPYAAGLYESGRAVLLDMGSSYFSDAYKEKVAVGMKAMLGASGPIYIHCMEGKDRTGFVCMLLEALAGASYTEMCADYMKTYENYYSVSEEKTPEKYHAIAELYFDSFLQCLLETEDSAALKDADYVQAAADYLIAGGMTPDETEQLRDFITDRTSFGEEAAQF